jgi:hypothetical protein
MMELAGGQTMMSAPDSAGTTGCFVKGSVIDPNQPEDHRDLNADGEHAQTGSDRPPTQVLVNKLIQQGSFASALTRNTGGPT